MRKIKEELEKIYPNIYIEDGKNRNWKNFYSDDKLILEYNLKSGKIINHDIRI